MNNQMRDDLLQILKTIKMVSKDLYDAYIIHDCVWLHRNNHIIGYISHNHKYNNNFVISMHCDTADFRKEFKTRNELIIYLKKDFISDFVARLI